LVCNIDKVEGINFVNDFLYIKLLKKQQKLFEQYVADIIDVSIPKINGIEIIDVVRRLYYDKNN